MLDFFYSFQPSDIAQTDKLFSLSVTFLLSFKKLTWVHLPPFCLPFDNEGYHALCGFIFFKCHLAVISMTACFIQWPIKPLEKTQEGIRACERQSWGREGIQGFSFYFVFYTGKERTNPPLPSWSLFDDWCHLQYFHNPLDSTTFQSEWNIISFYCTEA